MTAPSAVAIVGAACRLPGAPNEAAFRDVLNHGRFTVGALPHGRWHPEMLYNPDPKAPGSTYTFAGGYLPDPYVFDIGAFGMSPREAAQVDPQQRILAEVVWDALEDARIAPTALQGREVGVYIGVSALDHANLFGADPVGIESHFMTGNTLSVVANRISYLFDLRGPSFVVDTACSSSLVAIDRALADLRSGRVDTAIVGGVNMLLSPGSFVGFSRAAMLSPTGACRPFSAQADGYVRSEGAVVFVLRRQDAAAPGSIRALIAGSAVNSDGRTSGIALPGLEGQRRLLELAYRDLDFGPDLLDFVEAHGTGTAVGDPIEATAIGEVLGRPRSRPLPIGSVKSNIGHLEPASGAAGMLKALIALEQRVLPATLHLGSLNPHIDFARLNLAPAAQAVPLGEGKLRCGVSSFGFGGTNAHIVLTSAPAPAPLDVWQPSPEVLTISAHCREALAELALGYADRLDAGAAPRRLASAESGGRALLRHRAVLLLAEPGAMADALREFAKGNPGPVVSGSAAGASDPKVCFVYAGNGAQWAGMGRAAYGANRTFARAFDEVERCFGALGMESLAALMHADDLAGRLASAEVAQPLLFAIQVGVSAALGERGLRPDMVLGHSVGEIAAAWAAGVFPLEQAARIVAARAESQQAVRGAGGMATLGAERGAVTRLIERVGGGLWIAAENGPASFTVAGDKAALAALLKAARRERIAGLMLAIDYPYHSPLLDGIRGHFLAELGIVTAREPQVTMISTVTGQSIGAAPLDAAYWWQNIRSEVRFRGAVAVAAERGANLFVEIGPRSMLGSAIAGSVEDAGLTARVIPSLLETDEQGHDPIAAIWCKAVANGSFPSQRSAGKPPPIDRTVDLPGYPWQHRTYRYQPSAAAIDVYGLAPRHPLIGARVVSGGSEWRTVIDTGIVPLLADHVVGGEVVVPATALAEMALAAARDLWPQGALALEDFDVVQALVLPEGNQREIAVRYAEDLGTVEVLSRPRQGAEEWMLSARGRIARHGSPITTPPAVPAALIEKSPDAVYANARRCGLAYGAAFRLIRAVRFDDDQYLEVSLDLPPPTPGFARGFVLHPASLDAALHAVFALLDDETGPGRAWLPIRFGRLVVARDAARVASATLVIVKSSATLKTISIWLRDEAGASVALLEGALLRSVPLARADGDPGFYRLDHEPAGLFDASPTLFERARAHFEASGVPERSEGWLLLRAHLRSAVYAAMRTLAGASRALDLPALVAAGKVSEAALPWLRACLGELAASGLLETDTGKPVLAPECTLPEADVLLASFAAEHPQAVTDLTLSGLAAFALRGAGERPVAPPEPRAGLIERAAASSLRIEPAVAGLTGCVAVLAEAAAPDLLHVVVAEAEGGALVAALSERAAAGSIRLSLAAADRAAAERASRRLAPNARIEVIDLSEPCEPVADILLALSAGAAPRSADPAALLREGGLLLAAGVRADAVAAFQGVCDPAIVFDPVADSLASEPGFADRMKLSDPAGDLTIYLGGKAAASAEVGRVQPKIHAIPAGSGSGIAERLDAGGPPVPGAPVLCLVDCGAGTLGETLLGLRTVLLGLASHGGRARCRIAVFARGAEGPARAAAVRAFVRTAMNEVSHLDLALVEIAEGVDEAAIAAALAAFAGGACTEREMTMLPGRRTVPRLRAGLPPTQAAAPPEAVRLGFPRPGMIETFEWVAAERPSPGPGEIAIAVEATGLNFRDVMLAMGLLGDDVLEDGLAGAVHGLECAGRVIALGEGAAAHRVGDRVFGFGIDSFASHVVGHEQSFVAVPAGLSVEATAGLPVAFYTAWYALVELARLREGERVLIHGGAGGVGLAAIQIAAALGAEVIATVSSPDKEAIARLYGAVHVYDSRSLAFADQVREAHGGVDVVLNSLSGDAMRASLKCLAPRGRFVELGKRDYVANSAIGLRPFRRNLSYFGVDVDQLLALDPALTRKGLSAIVEGLADGSFLPLPAAVHRSSEVGEAFRLMQSAGHVGKIVVVPPPVEVVAAAAAGGFVPGEGVQLVIGGTRGFGLATAFWLAESGTRRIVIASLSGKVDPASRARINALRKRGVMFAVEKVDVTDADDVTGLIARVAYAHGPVTGIFHAAVTLRDGMLEAITEDDLAAVLAPKVQGAVNLDRASRGQPIERFVLYSSVSALVGNPGQGAYAAANGYLEGLARMRRAECLPALAVQWGAIADVGLLADRAATLESLARVSGVVAMQSADALARLGTILAQADIFTDPVVACAEFAANGALQSLPVPASPAFAGVFARWSSAVVEAGMSLAELIAGRSEIEAQRLLGALVVEEVAQILRLAAQDIDLDAPIDGLGMDSLMALELRMSIESRYSVELPVMAITAAGSLRELSHRILRIVQRGGPDNDASPLSETETALIASHGGEASPRAFDESRPEGSERTA